ncbi:MAG: hypothetical protein DKT66_22260 [Candidatus Melainabacteria bacterium]|nr:MAG: hypothetical protein DKT66_22260 [Candidatus Melainabacteria bacterium]
MNRQRRSQAHLHRTKQIQNSGDVNTSIRFDEHEADTKYSASLSKKICSKPFNQNLNKSPTYSGHSSISQQKQIWLKLAHVGEWFLIRVSAQMALVLNYRRMREAALGHQQAENHL